MSSDDAEFDRLKARVASLEAEITHLRAIASPTPGPPDVMEEASASTLHSLSSVLDQLPFPAMVMDTTGRALTVTPMMKALWRGSSDREDFSTWSVYRGWRTDNGGLLAPEDWPIAKAISTAIAQPAVEIRFERFDGEIGLMLVSAMPIFGSGKAVIAGVAVAQDVTELRATQQKVAFDEDLLRRIGENTPDLIYAKDRQSRMIFANPAVLATIGRPWEEIAGRSDIEWHDQPEEATRFVADDDRVMASGQTESFEEELTGPGGTQTYLSSKTPLHDPEGKVIGVFGISTNITERKRSEAHRQLLMNELNHRVKNVLAVVQSVARQTVKPALGDPAAWRAFEDRLLAVAAANDLLIKDDWVSSDVGALVSGCLAAIEAPSEGRIIIAGPEVRVDGDVAVALAMALHELGVNAVKYGALSRPGGRVSIRWRLPPVEAAQSTLELSWVERGGPPVTPPATQGFGSRLIGQAFSRYGKDAARFEFHPDGLRFDLKVPAITL